MRVFKDSFSHCQPKSMVSFLSQIRYPFGLNAFESKMEEKLFSRSSCCWHLHIWVWEGEPAGIEVVQRKKNAATEARHMCYQPEGWQEWCLLSLAKRLAQCACLLQIHLQEPVNVQKKQRLQESNMQKTDLLDRRRDNQNCFKCQSVSPSRGTMDWKVQQYVNNWLKLYLTPACSEGTWDCSWDMSHPMNLFSVWNGHVVVSPWKSNLYCLCYGKKKQLLANKEAESHVGHATLTILSSGSMLSQKEDLGLSIWEA